MSEGTLRECTRDLRTSLDEMHKKVETSVQNSRDIKQKNMNKKRSPVKFDKVDNVLVLMLKLKISSNFSPDGIVFTKSLR